MKLIFDMVSGGLALSSLFVVLQTTRADLGIYMILFAVWLEFYGSRTYGGE